MNNFGTWNEELFITTKLWLNAMISMGHALGGNGHPSIFAEGSFRPKYANPRFGTSSPACADATYP